MILAIKTAGLSSHLALYASHSATRPKVEVSWESGRGLADELLTRISDILAANSVVWKDVSGIIIFSGPGSFTSLRIGHTVANALADSLNIPVVGELGEDWAGQALTALEAAPAGVPALPRYGAEANISTGSRPAPVKPKT